MKPSTTAPTTSPTSEPTESLQQIFNSILVAEKIVLSTNAGNRVFNIWSNNYQSATAYNSQKKSCKLTYKGKFALVTPLQYTNIAGLSLQKAAYQKARLPRSTKKPPTRSPTRRKAVQLLSEKGMKRNHLKGESNAASTADTSTKELKSTNNKASLDDHGRWWRRHHHHHHHHHDCDDPDRDGDCDDEEDFPWVYYYYYNNPSVAPSEEPYSEPAYEPSSEPGAEPTWEPGAEPTWEPGAEPTWEPAYEAPTNEPAFEPTYEPAYGPPTNEPAFEPTYEPAYALPTNEPTSEPTNEPGYVPTNEPGYVPTNEPGYVPTNEPGYVPTNEPGYEPTHEPTFEPSASPPEHPYSQPVEEPTVEPSTEPSATPSFRPTRNKNPSFIPTLSPVLDSIDWSSPTATPYGSALSAAVDQGGICVSSWAFATVGVIESALAIQFNQPVQALSVQQVVNCEPDAYGCNGGDVYTTLLWMKNSAVFTGLTTDTDIPYTSVSTGVNDTCIVPTNVVPHTKPISVKRITYSPGVLYKLQAALNIGPVAVSVTASSLVFQLYSTGIITDPTCGNGSSIDHVMIAVGYGTMDGVPYIKCKNSWGPLWGESGYVYIGADEKQNYCGIMTDFSYPLLV